MSSQPASCSRARARRARLHIRLVLAVAILAAAAITPLAATERYETDLRTAVYVGTLLAVYLCTSIAVGFRRRT